MALVHDTQGDVRVACRTCSATGTSEAQSLMLGGRYVSAMIPPDPNDEQRIPMSPTEIFVNEMGVIAVGLAVKPVNEPLALHFRITIVSDTYGLASTNLK